MSIQQFQKNILFFLKKQGYEMMPINRKIGCYIVFSDTRRVV